MTALSLQCTDTLLSRKSSVLGNESLCLIHTSRWHWHWHWHWRNLARERPQRSSSFSTNGRKIDRRGIDFAVSTGQGCCWMSARAFFFFFVRQGCFAAQQMITIQIKYDTIRQQSTRKRCQLSLTPGLAEAANSPKPCGESSHTYVLLSTPQSLVSATWFTRFRPSSHPIYGCWLLVACWWPVPRVTRE